MFTGTLTLCAFIALFGTVAAIAWPMFERYCEAKGITEDGVEDYEKE